MYRLIIRLARTRDDGVTTIEYCMCGLAAAGFAGVLYKVLSSPAVQAQLTDVIQRALA
jgi:hypothetical protein